MNVEGLIGGWITGVTPRSSSGRVVVVESDDAVDVLIADNLLDDCAGLFHRRTGVLPAPLRERSQTFAGSFLGAESDVRFGGGFHLRQNHYGTADFLPIEIPTVLRVSDDDDFSAFLRDADSAMETGRFAPGVSHRLTVIADACGLGADTGSAGPGRRVYIGPSGTVSTSPTGLRLGVAGEPWQLIERRWQEANATSRRPCAVCLAAAVNEPDRVDALSERPWLAAYLRALVPRRPGSRDMSWPEADRTAHRSPPGT